MVRIMKRKLNTQDVPQEVEVNSEAVSPAPVLGEVPRSEKAAAPASPRTETPQFQSLNLDARLLQAIAKQSWSSPTRVQLKTIPLALEGRDLLGARISRPQ